ncbi:hypothetical protein UFOVP1264_49 [uncultured Caudovirales phage]|uniref:Uncharacterized protein n=1 Tax=uncultured Caudovirales phage TaxID=2100421 RepID=A0A6J5RRW0_9CAUD|nr:hypothetical protein UFOVP1264_49 [uncultured Caudovirales phage]
MSYPAGGIVRELILKDEDEIECLSKMANWLSEQLKELDGCDLVIVEKPIQGVSRNVRTGLSLGMVAGALAYTSSLHARVAMAPPTVWKKAVIGRGNADKPYVEQWLKYAKPALYQLCEQLRKPQDGIDATCLALYGEAGLAGRITL